MPIRHTCLALLGLALISGASASAQTSVDQTCLYGGQAGTGLTTVATNCPIGRTPALSEFRFGFLNGDHRLRVATIMPGGEYFQGAFADVNGDDPFYAEGRWLRVPEAQGGVVEAIVRGVADIPIPRGPANTTLVLSGFEFQRQDGTEANIRTLAVSTDSSRAQIRTVMLDDQNMNFEQLAVAVGIGFAIGATGVPDPNISLAATAQSNLLMDVFGANSALRPGLASYTFLPPENNPTMTVAATPPGAVEVLNTNARPYRVKIAYLWVPNARLANTRMVSGSDRAMAHVSGRLPGQTPHVLHGFSFHFGNSDHFIGAMGVHLSGGAPVSNGLSNTEVVSWEDNNRDDPVQWTARFSELVGQTPARTITLAPIRAPIGNMVITPAPAATSSTPPASTSPAPSSSSSSTTPAAEESASDRRARRHRDD